MSGNDVEEHAPQVFETEGLTVTAPDEATLRCRINRGSPPATITWYKHSIDTEPLQHNNKYTITTTQDKTILSIRNTDIDDSDDYVIKLHNGLGGDIKGVANNVKLDVNKKPEISPVSVDVVPQTIIAGNNLCKIFHVSGKPSPEVRMILNGDSVDDDDSLGKLDIKLDQNNRNSKIVNLTVYRAGIWTVKAENEFGHVSSSFLLTVKNHIVLCMMDLSEPEVISDQVNQLNRSIQDPDCIPTGLEFVAVKYMSSTNEKVSDDTDSSRSGKKRRKLEIMNSYDQIEQFEEKRLDYLYNIDKSIKEIIQNCTKEHYDTTYSLLCVGIGSYIAYAYLKSRQDDQTLSKKFMWMITVGSIPEIENADVTKFLKEQDHVVPLKPYKDMNQILKNLAEKNNNTENTAANKEEKEPIEMLCDHTKREIITKLQLTYTENLAQQPIDSGYDKLKDLQKQNIMVTGFYRKRIYEMIELLGSQLEIEDNKQYFKAAPLMKSDDFDKLIPEPGKVLLVATFTERMNLLMGRPDIGQVTEPYERAREKRGDVFLICTGMPKTYSLVDGECCHQEIQPLYRSQPELGHLTLRGHFISITEGGTLNKQQCNLLNEWLNPIQLKYPKPSTNIIPDFIRNKMLSWSHRK